MYGLWAGQTGYGGAGAGHQLAKAHLLLLVLPVPQHQGAVLLKKHGLLELGNQLRPTRHRIGPHGHHGRFGNGRFGQWGQHGSGHAGGCALGIGPLGLVHLHRVPARCQRTRQQTAHQPCAQHQHRFAGL